MRQLTVIIEEFESDPELHPNLKPIEIVGPFDDAYVALQHACEFGMKYIKILEEK